MLLFNVFLVYILSILTRSKRTYWLKAIPLGGLIALFLASGVFGMVNSYLDWEGDPWLIEGRIVKVVHFLPSKGFKDHYNVTIWLEGEQEPFGISMDRGEFDSNPLTPGQRIKLEYTPRTRTVTEIWYGHEPGFIGKKPNAAISIRQYNQVDAL
jgi:hypothetical protein